MYGDHLFSPLILRELKLRNRIMMSPMAMYCAEGDGLATEWHVTHYLSRAVGGVGLVMFEATAIESRGRMSQHDLGLWDDSQIEPLAHIVNLAHEAGAAVGMQLNHAGRKAFKPELGFGPEMPISSSSLPFDKGWQVPTVMDSTDMDRVIESWVAASKRCELAGFDVLEVHSAHGYLNHQFLSPLTNTRTDEYGGSLNNRMTFLLRVVEAVREVWPDHKPLFVRVSATDWVEGGLTVDDLVIVAGELKARGVDLVDCSTGGLVPDRPPIIGPGYQVPFAEKIRREADVPTAAVGLIDLPEMAEEVVCNGRADLVAIGRPLLRNPYWPLEAGHKLGQEADWPYQYVRGQLKR